jgi:hypothetical protein
MEAYQSEGRVRRYGGELLAKVSGVDALPLLLAALNNSFEVVRQSAADGLVALGEVSVPPLVARLEHSTSDEAADILVILGRLGSVHALSSILQHTNVQDPIVQTAAIRALAKFDTMEATRAVATAVTSPDWTIREAAVSVIGHWRWQNHEAVGLLSDAVQDSHPRVRAAAAQSLARLTGDARGVDEHLDGLLQHLELEQSDGDDAERARVSREISNLRGLLGFYFARTVLFEPGEGEQQYTSLKRRVEAVADLVPYRSAAAEVWRRPADRSEAREEGHAVPDNVRFTVTCPVAVTPQQTCLLDVWLHDTADLDAVLRYIRADQRTPSAMRMRSKGPVPISRGTTLVVTLQVPSLGWADEDSVYWDGNLGNATYSFVVPEIALHGDHEGHVHISAAGISIARVSFVIEVATAPGPVDDVTARQRRISSAFASYASEDRNEVLARIQGMLSVAPTLDIFMDAVSLRSGERWAERLEAEIVKRDVLYLFWSATAQRSHWVDREWRMALRTKGLDGISPVPLETADVAPPPTELASLHFNEWTLQMRHPSSP